MDVSRRDFIRLGAGAAVTSGAVAQAGDAGAGPVLLAQAAAPLGFDPADPALKFDLVIAGGDVLDPSQRLRATRDIGIKNGRIAAIAAGIPADRSVQRIDAAGTLVTPGLIDLHTHLCPHLGIGLPADELVGITATTTAVSAGDAGAYTFGNFRHGVVPQSRTRLFGFVHISTIELAAAAGCSAGHRCRCRSSIDRRRRAHPWFRATAERDGPSSPVVLLCRLFRARHTSGSPLGRTEHR